MIEIELNGKIIQVQSELTIGQYQTYVKNKELYDKEPARMLALYMGISYSQLKNLPKDQIEFVNMYITSQLMGGEYKDETYEVFEHKGIEYGLENDWSKLAWGAWVDLEVFSSDNIEDNIHRIMSVLYRPVITKKKGKYTIESYDSETIEERANIFKDIPLKYWLGAANFFFLVSLICINNTQSSLNTNQKANELIMKGWQILPKWIKKRIPLDSILLSHTLFQTKTLQSLNK